MAAKVFGLLAFISAAFAFHQNGQCGTIQLSRYQRQASNNFYMSSAAKIFDVDVAVLGGGIAGSSISWLLQEREKCTVALIDPRVDTPGTWYPNYGEWRSEWHHLSDRLQLPELKDCTTTEWESTNCYFGGSFDIPADEKTILDRPYVRVDRIKMQKLLRDRFSTAGGLSVPSKLLSSRISPNLFDKNLVHHAEGSTLTLDDGTKVNCKVLIDATGLESRLIGKEDPMLARGSSEVLRTGFQIAYGFIAVIDDLKGYDEAAMTLFDYRTEPFMGDPAWLKEVESKPTFMYTMPLSTLPDGTKRVFFEETSLVGMDERRLTFTECKKRALRRLEHLGMKVLGVEEEEYCYIPMGGELPDLAQRVVGFGGAANMVHPATGYHACRMLAASTDVASVVGKGIAENQHPDRIAADAYQAIWGKQNRGQRDFQAYGGDFLMEQHVGNIRGFFDAFFQIDQDTWSGFLAGWPGLPGNIHHETWNNRLKFALSMFFKMQNPVRASMILYAITYTFKYGPGTLLRSLTPDFLFGSGPAEYKWAEMSDKLGDDEAKTEAKIMMGGFVPTAGEHYLHGKLEAIVVEDAITTTDLIQKKDAVVREDALSYPSPFNS